MNIKAKKKGKEKRLLKRKVVENKGKSDVREDKKNRKQ